MEIDPRTKQRMKELIDQIEIERNHDKLTALIQELNRLLGDESSPKNPTPK